MAIGERLKIARKEAGLTQEELAQKAGGPSRTQIVAYEKNNYQPSLENMEKIANVLGKPVKYFYSEGIIDNQINESSPNFINLPIYKEIPVRDKDIQPTEFLYFPSWLILGADFAYRVKSDLMSPRINPGDLVLIRKQKFFEDGNIVLIRINESTEICRAFHIDNEISLQNYKRDKIYQNKEFAIIGKIIKNICSFE